MQLVNKRNFIVLFILLLGVAQTGCKKQLDINQDPNFPTLDEGNPSLVFPVGVLGTIAETGGDLAIAGGMLSQFFTQASLAQQYADVDSYNMPSTDRFVNDPWITIYPSALENFQYVIDHAKASSDWNYYLVGTVMKAYATEVLVDMYDQAPYFQALQGAENLNPKFDDGYTIYTDLLKSMDTALAKDFSASTNSAPGKQDLVFGGDMQNWIAFANTLKLKMYLRMINAHPDVAQTGITDLYNSGAVFLTTDAAVTNFVDAPGLDNPEYESNKRILNTPSNLRASTTFVSWLSENNDPRLVYFYQGPTNSINQGDYAVNNATYQSAHVFRNTDHTEATDPVEFLSLAESYFLQAEADVRYFGGANAKTLYDQGVMAAFAATGNDGSSFIAPGGAYEWGNELEGGVALEPIAQIIRQKWASCAYGCHGIESFFEKNRTGYPATSTVYSDNPGYIPGQWVIVKNSVLPPGQMPKRFVFPYSETTTNSSSPALVPITTAVWWGK
ncbi:MAG TPA: SusD/RagB family nutrient-binding outer membrane lipoprotein [Chitinophagaceae bacterium]